MSRAHHNATYFEFVKREHPECAYCGSYGEQLHHLQVVGARKYRGPLPRRHSSYNVIHLCRACHDESHALGDGAAAKKHLGGERLLYQLVLAQLHEFIDWLMEGR